MANPSFATIAMAARAGNMSIISDWVDSGADVNQPLDSKGDTALHHVCQTDRASHNEDLLLFLLGSGAQPATRNVEGSTPLHVACRSGNVDAVRVLLQFGADPMAHDTSRHTCLAIARQRGNADVLAELARYTGRSPSVGSKEVSQFPTSRASSTKAVPTPQARTPAPSHSARPEVDGPTADLLTELQRRATTLQKENLLLDSKARGAEETKRRLDAALKAKVELEVALQQKQMELDDFCYRQNKREKETRQRELTERVSATSSLETEKLQLESEVRRLTERLEQEMEEKMTARAQLDVKASAMEELQAALRTLRAEKAKTDVQLSQMETLRNTIADLQQQNNLLRLDVDAAQSLQAALTATSGQKVQLEGQLRDLTQELTEVRSQLAMVQARNREAESSLQQERQQVQTAVTNLQELERDRARLQVQVQGMVEELQRLRSERVQDVGEGPNRLLHAEETIERMQEEKGTLTSQVVVYQQQVAQLREQLAVLREERQALAQQVALVPVLQTRLDSRERELQQLQHETTQRREDMEAMTDANRQLQREKAGLENTLKDMMHYQDLCESLAADKERLEGERSQQTVVLRDLEAALRDQQRAKQALQQQVLEGEQKVNAVEKDLASVQRELRRALDDVARLQAEQRQQVEVEGDGHLEREVLQSRVLNTQAENLRLLGEVKRLQDEISIAQEEAQRYKTDNELYLMKLDQTSHNMGEAWTKHKRQKEELEAQLEGALEQSKSLQEDRDRKAEEIQQLKEDMRELRLGTQSLQRELDDALHTLDMERQRLMLMNQERQGLELQMKSLRDQAAIAPPLRGTATPGLGTPVQSDHRYALGGHATALAPYPEADSRSPSVQSMGRGVPYGGVPDTRLASSRAPQFLSAGYEDSPDLVPRPRALGALKEDERRERMGPISGLRNTGINLVKSKSLPNKAMEAEAFFAAHRRISQR